MKMNGILSRLLILAFASLVCLALAVSANAQQSSGGDYKITSSVIAGGGSDNSSAGGGYVLSGTSGQAAAGGPFESIPFFSLMAGFWATLETTSATHNISGQVTHNGVGLKDVAIRLERSGVLVNTTQTDNSGHYSFNNLQGGQSYSVTPSKDGYVFAPFNAPILNLSSDITANFSVASRFFKLSGQVISGNGQLGDVTLTLKFKDGLYATTVTDALGNYSFSNVNEGGPYTIEPQKAGYNFTPPTKVFNNVDADQTANFTATNTPPPPPPPSIQFEMGGYTVSEGDHYKFINVTRTGELSQPAAVDYESADIIAGQRSDYTILLGQLKFAAGETSKTLTLLVTEDSLVEGAETLNLALSNPAGAVLGNQSQVQVIITDNDNDESAPNAIDEVESFVRQHYHDFLNREPEPGGFEGWQEILNRCASGDTKCDRIEVSSAFYRSQEFHDRGYCIYRFYVASLGHVPKYQEFMRDMQKVSGFLSIQQQEDAKRKFIEEFMNRNEFRQKYDQLSDAGSYVDAILSTAGVQLPQREQLVSELRDGKITRAEALRAIIESKEVDAKFYNESFVVMQYFGYLRRDPDILYLDWIKTLDETNDYRIMVNGFLNSVEYRGRFGK
jgi:hypothetical protein